MPWRPKWLRNHVLSLSYAGGVSGGDLAHRGLYSLGGYPPQNLLTSIYDFSRPGECGAARLQIRIAGRRSVSRVQF